MDANPIPESKLLTQKGSSPVWKEGRAGEEVTVGSLLSRRWNNCGLHQGGFTENCGSHLKGQALSTPGASPASDSLGTSF